MKRIDLTIEKRERIGKGSARSTRRQGGVPGVIYGGGQAPLAVAADRLTLEKLLKQGSEAENLLLNLNFADGQDDTLALLRATQHNPINGFLEHCDFQRVSLEQIIHTTVPIHTVGSPIGVRQGGVFELHQREVEIECKPLDIPDAIEVDTTNMAQGDALHVSDLPENPNIRILTDASRTIAAVTAPSTAGAAEDEEGGATEAAAEEA